MAASPSRLSGPVRRLAVSLLALGRIRLELLAVEVQKEKQRIASLLLWTVLMALMTGFGAVFIALLVTALLWDSHRLAALGGSALLFIGLALLGLYRVRRLSADGTTLFQSSIAELQHDGTALREGPPP
jgi:uncharacterized membrane protein YqjE